MRSWLWSKIEQRLPRIIDSTQVNHAVVGQDKPWYFSERRFLVFGKKGPWELVIKPRHVGISALLFSSFIFTLGYFSVQTINTALSVANQELISPADASLIATKKHSIELEKLQDKPLTSNVISSFGPLKKDNSIANYLFSMKVKDIKNTIEKLNNTKNIDNWHDQPLEYINENFELSNILLETKKIREQMLSSFEQKKSDPLYQEIQIVIKVPEINENSIPNSIINNFDEKLNYKNRSDLHFETKTLPESGAIENFESVVEHAPSLVESNVVSINKDILGPDNMPTILDDTIRGARFLKSIDREVKVIEKVFDELGIKLSVPESAEIQLANLNWPMQPGSIDYLEYMRKQFIKLDVYRDALTSLPLHSPMKYYYISSKYGKRKHPVTKKWAMHHGIDLAGTWQEKVRATADGTVISSGWEGSFGRVVRVQHRFGIETVYAHLARLNVKKGDYITAGDIVGSMGSSGRSDGAHLHYEIRVNNKSKNPKQFFDVGQSLLSPSSLRSSAF
mgnify:CR=1 FL=1